jgi:hypothetical protein
MSKYLGVSLLLMMSIASVAVAQSDEYTLRFRGVSDSVTLVIDLDPDVYHLQNGEIPIYFFIQGEYREGLLAELHNLKISFSTSPKRREDKITFEGYLTGKMIEGKWIGADSQPHRIKLYADTANLDSMATHFADTVIKWIVTRNKTAFAERANYPLRCYFNGKKLTIRSRSKLISLFDKLFTPEFTTWLKRFDTKTVWRKDVYYGISDRIYILAREDYGVYRLNVNSVDNDIRFY